MWKILFSINAKIYLRISLHEKKWINLVISLRFFFFFNIYTLITQIRPFSKYLYLNVSIAEVWPVLIYSFIYLFQASY